ncbi:MAG: hypothetical protein U9R12_03215 [Candidatus Caldatribacteriota bacterium]|nr:hypothetical protein [Candidatus Caldatribacteriota bacterium]
MDYGPSLPPTGGAIAGSALVWGIYSQTWIVIVFSAIALITMLYGLYRLQRGQKSLQGN